MSEDGSRHYAVHSSTSLYLVIFYLPKSTKLFLCILSRSFALSLLCRRQPVSRYPALCDFIRKENLVTHDYRISVRNILLA